MVPTPPPSESKLEVTRGGAEAPNKYELSKRGEIAAEFEFLRNNLQHYAKLTSHSDASKPEENLETLLRSTD